MTSAADFSAVMVVLAHPRTGSLCHRLAERVVSAAAATGVEVTLHDLYVEGFDPVLLPEEAWQHNLTDGELLTEGHPGRTTGAAPGTSGTPAGDPMVARHRRELDRVDGLVVIHPDWWGKPPAILTGWLDRVLVPVCGASPPAAAERGPRRVLVINTTDEPGTASRHDPLGLVWRQGVGSRLSTDELERISLTGVSTATGEQQERWLSAAERGARWVSGGDR